MDPAHIMHKFIVTDFFPVVVCSLTSDLSIPSSEYCNVALKI